MKALRILPALIGMCMAINGLSQVADSSEVYYQYELVPTENLVGTDTVYQAFLVIDSLIVNQFKKLIVLNDDNEKIITIKSKQLDNDPAISTDGPNYRIAIDYWSNIESWMVIGEKEDQSKKNFNKKEKAKTHKVIDTPIPVNYSLRSDTTLVNLNEL